MDHFQIVIRAAELGSFSAAAKSLSLSQSTVSRRIEGIERQIGASLFVRKGRNFQLTDTGRFYYEKAQEVANVTRQAEKEIMEQTGRRLQTISIAAHESFGTYVLPKLVHEFYEMRPGVRFQLSLQSNIDLSFNKGYDFYLQDGNLRSSSMHARKIGRVEVNVYAAPSFIERHGIKAGGTERWDQLPYCMLDAYYAVPLKDKIMTKGELDHQQQAIQSNDLNTLIRCAEEGFGIIFLADHIAKPSVDSGALVKINRKSSVYNSVLYILFNSEPPLSPIAKEFKEYFVKRLGGLLAGN